MESLPKAVSKGSRSVRFRFIVALPVILFCLSVASGWGAIIYYEFTGGSVVPDMERALQAWGFILAIGVASALMGGAMAVGITKPLHKLMALADRITPDQPDLPTSPDEVALLVTAFNRMMLPLDRYISDSYILNNLPVGVMVTDEQGRVSSLNSVANTILGLETEPGRDSTDIRLTTHLPHTPENKGAHQAIEAAFSGSETELHKATATFLSSTGKEILVLLEIRPFRRETASHRNQVIINFRSLQQQAQVREEIQRTTQLATLGSLAAGLAHEFKNPLGSIQGMAELVKEDIPDENPQHQYLTTIVHETQRMTEMIEELLTMTRTAGERSEPIEVTAVLKEAAGAVTAEASKKGVELSENYSSELPTVHARPMKLQDALLNILRNAVHATPQGGHISITVCKQSAEDASQDLNAVPMVAIRITNTGSYISQEEMERIFLPFVTTKSDGTGLGLFLAQQFLESQGGRIRVESTRDQGTTFEILLSPTG